MCPFIDSAASFAPPTDWQRAVSPHEHGHGHEPVSLERPSAPPPSSTRACLTRRQREVVELAAHGRSQKWIAFTLGIAQSTVATHLGKALRRIDVDRAHLAGVMLDDGVALETPPAPGRAEEVLTVTERLIADAACRGESNAQIALARRRSLRTIANQLASAYRKLGVASRGELFARLAIEARQNAANEGSESESETETETETGT